MSYNFMSNIQDFDNFNDELSAYQIVNLNEEIPFIDIDSGVSQKASFLMIRAHKSNDLLIQITPYKYGVYIPAGELWSVDSLKDIEGIIVKNAFDTNGQSLSSGKIQWMIGYK